MLRKFRSLFCKSDINMTFNPMKVKINGLQYYLRKADSSDIVNILDLQYQLCPRPLCWNIKYLTTEITNPENIYLVLYCRQQLAAVLGLKMSSDEGHIAFIGVKLEYQFQGIGTLLLQQAITLVQNNYVDKITLEVNVKNVHAQRIYRKMGFIPDSIRKNYYATLQEDAINMVLKL